MPFNLPTPILEASFIDAPASGSPTWTNITPYLRSWSSARGRQLDMPSGTGFDVGGATITLDNRDGRFDPTYTSSPYYPHVIPCTRVRLRATWNAVTYPVWDMFADGWPSTYTGGRGGDEYVTVTLNDAMGLLGDDTYYVGSIVGEMTDARISRVLTQVGLNSLPQSLGAGRTHVVAATNLVESALSHIQAVELSEYGAFFVARDGTITFQNRYARAGASSQATFGDAGGELPYTDLQPSDDKTTILNDAVVTDGVGATFEYTDAASKTKYSQRSQAVSSLTDTPNEGYDQAAWIVVSQKDHSWRVPSISLMPQSGANHGGSGMLNAMWAQALGREISDLITVKRRPPSGNIINQTCFIERIEHSVSPGSWTTTFGLSPQRLTSTSSFFILDSATLGKLDTGTLGY